MFLDTKRKLNLAFSYILLTQLRIQVFFKLFDVCIQARCHPNGQILHLKMRTKLTEVATKSHCIGTAKILFVCRNKYFSNLGS